MTHQVVFSTPGNIDVRAFTVLGMNVKPNTANPIGYFGTGLKYAIAVLCRLKCEVSIWVGETEYKFYLKAIDFRGQDFHQLRMRKTRGLIKTYQELPFTTQFGKDWEMWMAFRELESNTRDEQGHTFLTANDVNTRIDKDRTTIIVTSNEFAEVYEKRHEVFLNGGVQKDGENTMQVIEKPSEFMYYRGLRVFKPSKPSIMTWNILEHQFLTEDRTLKYQVLADIAVAKYITKSTDEDFIKKCLTADKEKYEGHLPFSQITEKPSDQFMRQASFLKSGHGAYGLYRGFSTPVVRSTKTWEQKLAEAIRSGQDDAVLRLIKANRDAVLRLLDKVVDGQADDVPF